MDPLRLWAAAAIVFFIATCGLGWEYYATHEALLTANQRLASTSEAYGTAQQALIAASSTNTDLSTSLMAEKARNDDFSGQLNSLTSSVGTLTKLSQTDPQLLQKYSKVYFLNENYVPASLTTIATSSLYDQSRTLQFQSQAYPFLDALLADAHDQGVDLLVASAYRSFAQQASLKTSYKMTYGSGANAFSADQGYSEHQLGTTVDFTTASLKGNLTGFDKTSAYAWLQDNAYKYGFIISYPKSNTYYEYEPWHWRFVGKSLAAFLHANNEFFYDLDQRTINTYLVSLFNA